MSVSLCLGTSEGNPIISHPRGKPIARDISSQQGTEALSFTTCEELDLANNHVNELGQGPSPVSLSGGTQPKLQLFPTERPGDGGTVKSHSDSQPMETGRYMCVLRN